MSPTPDLEGSNKILFDLIVSANKQQTEALKKSTEEQTTIIKQQIQVCVTDINNKLNATNQNIENLKSKYLFLERKSRRNNIIIFGLNNVERQNLLQNTLSDLNRLLKINLLPNDINNIQVIGKTQKPPVLLEFTSFLKKSEIFPNLKHLKNTGISIANDLCPEDREQQKYLREHQLEAREQNLEAKIKGSKLLINGTIYTIDDLKELEKKASKSSDSETSSGDEENLQEKTKTSNPVLAGGSEANQNTQETKSSTHSKKRKRAKIYFPTTTSTDGEIRQTRSKNKS